MLVSTTAGQWGRRAGCDFEKYLSRRFIQDLVTEVRNGSKSWDDSQIPGLGDLVNGTSHPNREYEEDQMVEDGKWGWLEKEEPMSSVLRTVTQSGTDIKGS